MSFTKDVLINQMNKLKKAYELKRGYKFFKGREYKPTMKRLTKNFIE